MALDSSILTMSLYSNATCTINELEFEIGDTAYINGQITATAATATTTVLIQTYLQATPDTLKSVPLNTTYNFTNNTPVEIFGDISVTVPSIDTTAYIPGKYYLKLTLSGTGVETTYLYVGFEVVAAVATVVISGVSLSPSSITQAQNSNISMTIMNATYAYVQVNNSIFGLTNTTGNTWTGIINGANLSAGAHTVIITAGALNEGDIDVDSTLTVTATEDEINYLLGLIKDSIEADSSFNDFEVYNTGQMPFENGKPLRPPQIVIELLDADPSNKPLLSEGGVYKRIEYNKFRVHLIYKRSLKKTIGGIFYEEMKLANWFKKEMQSNLENMSFGILNIDDYSTSGTAKSEGEGVKCLYGCIVDLMIGYQTLEA